MHECRRYVMLPRSSIGSVEGLYSSATKGRTGTAADKSRPLPASKLSSNGRGPDQSYFFLGVGTVQPRSRRLAYGLGREGLVRVGIEMGEWRVEQRGDNRRCL